MAIMPGADFLNAATSSLMSRYDIVCIHTIVGYAPAHAAHFSTKANGYLYQSRDTKYRSAANLNGNHRVIAIENEDHGAAFGYWNTGDGHQVPGFTPQQIETIAKVCAWAYKTHGIPLVLAPDSKPGSRGIAYHRQGIDSPNNYSGYQYGGRVAGGEEWSTLKGKVCPGDRRITQLINEIIPRARVIAGLENDDDMAVEDVERMMWKGGAVAGSVAPSTLIDDVNRIKQMLWEGGDVPGSTEPGTVVDDLNVLREMVFEMDGKLNAILALLAEES